MKGGADLTEKELRKKLADTAAEYFGAKEGGGKYAEIIRIYNAIRPLPQGYVLKDGDSWCAAFVSAMASKCGLLDIIPAECSCLRQVAGWQQKGRWIEDDAYVPSVGDYIYYDWQDDGKGDNRGVPDHVGIVTEVSGKRITVIEGNVSDSVNYRYIVADSKNIRGYGLPDFASKAKEEESVRYKTINDVPAGAYRDAVNEFVELGIINGKSDGTLDISEDVIRGMIFGKRYADKKINELADIALAKLIEKLKAIIK